MSVVPGHEVCRAVAARKFDTGDVEVTVGACTGGEDHRVVVTAQVRQRNVGAVVHVADEPDLVARQHPAQRLDDLLDPRVIGSDAVPDQTVRGWETVEHVDACVPVLLGQDVCGIDSRGTCTDDCYLDRPHNRLTY
jgi:hypothetical protein